LYFIPTICIVTTFTMVLGYNPKLGDPSPDALFKESTNINEI